jgi:hypothetical protein
MVLSIAPDPRQVHRANFSFSAATTFSPQVAQWRISPPSENPRRFPMSIVPDETTRRPSLLESVIRFLVWSAILGCIATPVLVMALVYGKLLGVFWSGNSAVPPPPLQINLGSAAPPKPKIVTGVLAEERDKQIARLKSLTGRPEQVSGSATSLQIVAVTFEGTKPGVAETAGSKSQSVDDDGYRRLTLDIGQTPQDAVLIIADQPIRWRLDG